jgi:hypothetical protein
MLGDMPKQALAAREAHEALRDLKLIVDEATTITHIAELESFREAIHDCERLVVRDTLQKVVRRLKSRNFDAVLSRAREKLDTAVSILPTVAGRAGSV